MRRSRSRHKETDKRPSSTRTVSEKSSRVNQTIAKRNRNLVTSEEEYEEMGTEEIKYLDENEEEEGEEDGEDEHEE